MSNLCNDFYSSFKFKGVEYTVGDSVYLLPGSLDFKVKQNAATPKKAAKKEPVSVRPVNVDIEYLYGFLKLLLIGNENCIL